jgi:lysophospholipase L1-like esterase
MDYTQSDANVVDISTGHRMHQSTAPITTEVSPEDLNGLTWEVLELIKAADIVPLAFNKTVPGTYTQVRDAVALMIKMHSFSKPGLGSVLRTVEARLSEHVSILDKGGKDDNGVTNNHQPLVDAIILAGVNGTVRFPKTSTGIYSFGWFFWNDPAVAAIIAESYSFTFDVDPGLTFSFPGDYPNGMTVTLTRPVKMIGVEQNTKSVLTSKSHADWANKQLWLSEGDLDRAVCSALVCNDGSSLKHYLLGWTSNNWVDTAAAASDASSVTLTENVVNGASRVSMAVARPGTETSINFELLAGTTMLLAVFVRTTDGYHIVQMGADQANAFAKIGKHAGGAYSEEYFAFHGMANHKSYSPVNSVVTIRVNSWNSYALLLNGYDVFSFDKGGDQTVTGTILEVGFGMFPGALNDSIKLNNWTQTSDKTAGGKGVINVAVFGDSISSEQGQVWTESFREAMEGSFGMRVHAIDNHAVAGQGSENQRDVMTALTWAAKTNLVIIQVGTNDVQAGIPVGAFLSAMQTMITYVKARTPNLVIGMPPMWWTRAQANHTGATPHGRDTTLYEKGAPYRAGLLRLCAVNGVKLVDNLQLLGPSLAGYVNPESPGGNFTALGLDPITFDNIHPSHYGSRLLGWSYARAAAGLLVKKPARALNTQFLAADLKNGWTGSVEMPGYSMDENGNVKFSGILTDGGAAVKANGTLVLALPRHLYTGTKRFLTYACDVSGGATSPMMLYSAPDGLHIQMFPASGSTGIFLDPVQFNT